MPKKSHKVLEQIRKMIREEIQKLDEANESIWTWIYKGMLSGLFKAEKKGGLVEVNIDDVARAAAFLVKTEFGAGAKNDFIKSFKKSI
jgi:hypothetical protein